MTVERIVEGVYELGTRTVNSYIIDGDDGVTLVDTLVSGKEGLIEESLKELGRSLTDVKAILLTHSHMDHTGSAAAIKSASNAALYASEPDTPAIEGAVRPPMPPTSWYSRPMFWLSVFFPSPPPAEVDCFVSEDKNERLPGDLRELPGTPVPEALLRVLIDLTLISLEITIHSLSGSFSFITFAM